MNLMSLEPKVLGRFGVLLMLSLLGLSSTLEAAPTLSTSPGRTWARGREVPIRVVASGLTGFRYLSCEVSYNPQAAEFLHVVPAPRLARARSVASQVVDSPGRIRVDLAFGAPLDASECPASLGLFQAVFRVLDPSQGFPVVSVLEYAGDDMTVASRGAELRKAPSLPAQLVFSAKQNEPNPFIGETAIEFTLPSAQRVNLRVYDVSGRKVATVLDEVIGAGSHRTRWLGRDDAGNRMGAGIYFYSITAGSWCSTHKMVLGNQGSAQ